MSLKRDWKPQDEPSWEDVRDSWVAQGCSLLEVAEVWADLHEDALWHYNELAPPGERWINFLREVLADRGWIMIAVATLAGACGTLAIGALLLKALGIF